MKKVGSRIQVYRGSALATSGGLRKSDLKLNSKKKVVSKKASAVSQRKSNLKGFLIRKRSTRVRKKPKRYGYKD